MKKIIFRKYNSSSGQVRCIVKEVTKYFRKRKRCLCGSREFVTQPNQYDIYKWINGKLVMTGTSSTYDRDILYCRKCPRKYIETEDGFIRRHI